MTLNKNYHPIACLRRNWGRSHCWRSNSFLGTSNRWSLSFMISVPELATDIRLWEFLFCMYAIQAAHKCANLCRIFVSCNHYLCIYSFTSCHCPMAPLPPIDCHPPINCHFSCWAIPPCWTSSCWWEEGSASSTCLAPSLARWCAQQVLKKTLSLPFEAFVTQGQFSINQKIPTRSKTFKAWLASQWSHWKTIFNILEEEQTELPITRSYLIFVTVGTLPHYFSL